MNVILITVDSLRADQVGCYTPDRQPSLTPNLDVFAQRSLRFTQAFTQGPYTTYAVPTIFTGRYPCRLKPMSFTLRWEQPAGVVVEGTPTLTELLREAGYSTAGFHSNPLLSRLFGFHKGFDVFYDDVLLSHSTLPAKLSLWMARAHRVFRVDPFMGAEALTRRALAWLEGAREPFFLWIHYMDTHGPYLKRKVLKYLSRGERLWRRAVRSPRLIKLHERAILWRNYRSQIVYLDAVLGRLCNVFEEKGLFKRSLVVITADHGDEFFEHNGFSHSHKLYDELLHVPLLVYSPGVVPGCVEDPTELIQIVPTALEFAGIKPSEVGGLDAANLLPIADREAGSRKGYILSEAGVDPHAGVCVRTKDWKLIWEQGGKQKQLFNLVDDPGEHVNLAPTRREILAQLEQKVTAHLSGAGAKPEGGTGERKDTVELSEAEEQLVLERLRDLGYI